MIDWHTHLLPKMDDGSRDVAESLAMLAAQAQQGVDTVIATPHFQANRESVSAFLERRERSLEQVSAQLPTDAPTVLLGAEVRYYQGISRLDRLNDLAVHGRVLLVEMPSAVWTEYMLRELSELAAKSNLRVVLAHVERYLGLQKPHTWERLCENGVRMQVNASFFTSLTSRRKALSLLKKGYIHVLGSDCHNMVTRPPELGKAVAVIRKKLGDEFVAQMNEYGEFLLAMNNIEQ